MGSGRPDSSRASLDQAVLLTNLWKDPRGRIDDRFRDLREKLARIPTQLSGQEEVEHDVRKSFRTLMGAVGGRVWSSLRRVVSPGGRELQLFFWPGYTSTGLEFLGTADSRVVPEDDYSEAALVDAGFEPIFGYLRRGPDGEVRLPGRSFGRRKPQKNRLSRTALYYDLLLDPRHAAIDAPYVVGGTHNWAALGTVPTVSCTATARRQLRLLAVSVHVASKADYTVRGGHVSIALPEDSVGEWGQVIAEVLNNPDLLDDVHAAAGERSWPMPYRSHAHGGDASVDQRISEGLYAVWLGASFGKWREWATETPDWLRKLIRDAGMRSRSLAQRLEELVRLEQALTATGSPRVFRSEEFVAWTTLLVPSREIPWSVGRGEEGAESRPRAGKRAAGGSLMVLTSHTMETEVLLGLAQWAGRMFDEVHLAEASAEFAAKRSSEEQRLYRGFHAHQLGTELSFLVGLARKAREEGNALVASYPTADLVSDLREAVRILTTPGFTTSLDKGLEELRDVSTDQTLFDEGPGGWGRLLRSLCLIEGEIRHQVIDEITHALLPGTGETVTRMRNALDDMSERQVYAERLNNALYRLDSSAGAMRLGVTPWSGGESPDQDLGALVDNAFVVALTRLLEQVDPGDRAPTGEYARGGLSIVFPTGSARVLKKKWWNWLPTEEVRRKRPRVLAQELRSFVGQEINADPSIGLQVDLGGPVPPWRLSGSADAVLALDVFFREGILNALKALIVPPGPGERRLSISVEEVGDVTVTIRNSCDPAYVKLGLSENHAGSGHFGTAFMGDIASKLFVPKSYWNGPAPNDERLWMTVASIQREDDEF